MFKEEQTAEQGTRTKLLVLLKSSRTFGKLHKENEVLDILQELSVVLSDNISEQLSSEVVKNGLMQTLLGENVRLIPNQRTLTGDLALILLLVSKVTSKKVCCKGLSVSVA